MKDLLLRIKLKIVLKKIQKEVKRLDDFKKIEYYSEKSDELRELYLKYIELKRKGKRRR